MNDKEIIERLETVLGCMDGFRTTRETPKQQIEKIISDLKKEDKLQKEHEEKLISSDWLKEIHPELNLTTQEAEDLKQFCKERTIEYKECYGEGQIMLPKWKEHRSIKK